MECEAGKSVRQRETAEQSRYGVFPSCRPPTSAGRKALARRSSGYKRTLVQGGRGMEFKKGPNFRVDEDSSYAVQLLYVSAV